MNMFLRSLIVLLPVLILVFFAKILLVDDEIKFKDFESKNFPDNVEISFGNDQSKGIKLILKLEMIANLSEYGLGNKGANQTSPMVSDLGK